MLNQQKNLLSFFKILVSEYLFECWILVDNKIYYQVFLNWYFYFFCKWEAIRKQDLFDRFLEGKKNSLGQVPSIFKEILDHQITIDDVYDLYAEEHPIVSMRVSNLMKRLWREDGKLIKFAVTSSLRLVCDRESG